MKEQNKQQNTAMQQGVNVSLVSYVDVSETAGKEIAKNFFNLNVGNFDPGVIVFSHKGKLYKINFKSPSSIGKKLNTRPEIVKILKEDEKYKEYLKTYRNDKDMSLGLAYIDRLSNLVRDDRIDEFINQLKGIDDNGDIIEEITDIKIIEDYNKSIETIANAIKQNPDKDLTIVSGYSSEGPVHLNKLLGELRAYSMKFAIGQVLPKDFLSNVKIEIREGKKNDPSSRYGGIILETKETKEKIMPEIYQFALSLFPKFMEKERLQDLWYSVGFVPGVHGSKAFMTNLYMQTPAVLSNKVENLGKVIHNYYATPERALDKVVDFANKIKEKPELYELFKSISEAKSRKEEMDLRLKLYELIPKYLSAVRNASGGGRGGEKEDKLDYDSVVEKVTKNVVYTDFSKQMFSSNNAIANAIVGEIKSYLKSKGTIEKKLMDDMFELEGDTLYIKSQDKRKDVEFFVDRIMEKLATKMLGLGEKDVADRIENIREKILEKFGIKQQQIAKNENSSKKAKQ